MGVGVGVAVAIGVATGVGLTTGLAITPLPHTNFFPDLTHVYFLPATMEEIPTFVHFIPALGVAACRGEARRLSDSSDAAIAQDFLIGRKYGICPTTRNS